MTLVKEADATAETVPSLVMERTFSAPPEAVFDAWSDPAKVAKWMGPGACKTTVDQHELKPGGGYRWILDEPDGVHIVSGTFIEVARPDRLSFTWMWESDDWGGVVCRVLLTFEAVDGGTKFTLEQTELPSLNAHRLHEEGWTGSFDKLAAVLSA